MNQKYKKNDLQEFLVQVPVETKKVNRSVSDEQPTTQERENVGDTVQWMCLPDSKFCGSGPTRKLITPGAYRPSYNERYGVVLEYRTLITDDIVEFPDSTSDSVLASIQKFWTQKEKFSAMGQLFKRGILLWGPPGGGKTVTITLLTRDLIARGGIVLYVTNPKLAIDALELIRKVQPKTPIICVLEDLDEIITEYSEHIVLSLLDGENQIGDVIHIATTNYPQFLPSRLVNRPSRFDEIIKVGLPDRVTREIYLKSKGIEGQKLNVWVKETSGLSIAHLRELIIAVFCLGRSKDETIERLKSMANKIKSDSELKIGFE